MKDKIMRVDVEFKQLLNTIRTQRRVIGKDKRDLSDRRLTLAISRIKKLDEILVNSEIK